MKPWEAILKKFFIQLKHPNFVSDVLFTSTQHCFIFPTENFSRSHYDYQFDKVVNRLEHYVSDISAKKRPLFNLHSQIQFELPPENYVHAYTTIELPLISSVFTLRYLGQYAQLFDNPEEEPIPTWLAISWLLEDYGLSRMEEVPVGIHYRRISK